MSKTACLILSIGDKYRIMSEIARDSFRYFHEDIDLYFVTSKDEYYKEFEIFEPHGIGIVKFAVALNIMNKGYSKIIILGHDTITVDRLTEFLETNDSEILTTSDFNYKLLQDGEFLSGFYDHHNADVVCFNSKKALLEVIRNSIRYGYTSNSYKHGENTYCEQAGLNYVCNVSQTYTWKSIERVYGIYYNVLARGPDGIKGKIDNKFYVKDNKVFDSRNIQVKVWHYCAHFGGHKNWLDAYGNMNFKIGEEFRNLVNNIIGRELYFADKSDIFIEKDF